MRHCRTSAGRLVAGQTVADAASELGVSEEYVRTLCRTGALEAQRDDTAPTRPWIINPWSVIAHMKERDGFEREAKRELLKNIAVVVNCFLAKIHILYPELSFLQALCFLRENLHAMNNGVHETVWLEDEEGHAVAYRSRPGEPLNDDDQLLQYQRDVIDKAILNLCGWKTFHRQVWFEDLL